MINHITIIKRPKELNFSNSWTRESNPPPPCDLYGCVEILCFLITPKLSAHILCTTTGFNSVI